MRKEIAKEGIDAFIAKRGLTGWAPTQGHIPSGIPALGWFLTWAGRGEFSKALLIGKGSLFLGRMTNLFDGVSIMVEAQHSAAEQRGAISNGARSFAPEEAKPPASARSLRLGLTLPGSESGIAALIAAAHEARSRDPELEVLLFGEAHGDSERAHREMEKAIANGEIQGAVTFHHPFPLGTATVGMIRAPATGKELFIATTTGSMSTDRVEALVHNAIGGLAVAKAWGVEKPRLGLLNLDGAAIALKILRELEAKGYDSALAGSVRGDSLLRGNDVLAGTVDVLVCDSLTGNALMKVLAAYPAGGILEVNGSGYGPCVGAAEIPIGIISRATSAAVAAEALLYLARTLRGDLGGKYRSELKKAESAGLVAALASRRPRTDENAMSLPAKKPVDTEIEGVDVLELESAAHAVAAAGIYCEMGMGCTGPVIMVSKNDAGRAKVVLAEERFL
jgi:betaine reductase